MHFHGIMQLLTVSSPLSAKSARGNPGSRGAVSFRLMLVLLLTSMALLPIIISISINLPSVLHILESTIAEKQMADLKEKYFAVNREVTRRSESTRLLATIPGVHDIANREINGEVSSSLVHKRLSATMRKWFESRGDIKSIAIIDLSGMELYKMLRDHTGALRVAAPDELEKMEGMTEELRHLNQDHAGLSILAIHNRISWINRKHHIHHPEVTLGSPVYGSGRKIIAFATITMDLTTILKKFEYDFLVTGDGDYIYQGESHDIEHIHGPGVAFTDFPGLKAAILSRHPGVLTNRSGLQVAWVPIIINNRPDQTMWSGAVVDSSVLDSLKGQVVRRILLIVSIIFVIVMMVVWRFSSVADRFRQELVDSLRRLIEENRPMNFKWKRPVEIRELGDELNRLSRRYTEIMAERADAEARLSYLNRRLNMILDNAAEGILELDAEGYIQFVNPAACMILGFERDELLGNDLHSLVHYLREDRSQYPEEECPFCTAVKSGNFYLFREDVFWRQNGDSVNVEYLTAPMYDSNKKLMGLVMCIRDVTERKKAEIRAADLQKQLLHSQKMEAVGTLAGGVAHDFNNLLTAITGYSELLAMDLEGDEQALKQVKYIAAAARRASELTRQLLAFSRKQQAEKRIVEINELVRRQEKMLRRLIGESIELVTQLSEQEPLNTMADPGMIEQVIMNIVVNARDAMPEGGRILIRTEKKEIVPGEEYMYKAGRAGNFVCIAVEDTGSGIDPDTMKQIFNPFFTTKPVDKGTGLGLSVAYGIVEQHGGWINVYSEPGRGTVFKIFLPEYVTQSHHDMEEDGAEKRISVDGGGRKVLLLEDDVMVREIAREILESHGFVATLAENISQAREVFTQNQGRFDLVMSDVILPDGNGLDFIEWVLEQAPDTKVLLASGYIDESSHVNEIRKRGLPFIQKPFHVYDLLVAVEAAMKN